MDAAANEAKARSSARAWARSSPLALTGSDFGSDFALAGSVRGEGSAGSADAVRIGVLSATIVGAVPSSEAGVPS